MEAIEAQKAQLISHAEALQAKKQMLFGSVDISQPMSEEERLLNGQIARIWSDVNNLVRKKREILQKLKK